MAKRHPHAGLGVGWIVAVAVAAAGPARAETSGPAADELPLRWRAGHPAADPIDDGALRPEAQALLRAARAHPASEPFTMRHARALGLVRPGPALTTPSSIRVWRRGVDGSTSSCAGRVDVIPFDDYVRGVLPHEWIRSWTDESLKAGAVAIRTYAAWWVEAGGKYPCADLDDTTASQVYRDDTYPETDAAVAATAGAYVVQAGELVFAEYSAENSDPTEFGVAEPLCTGQARRGHGRGVCQWGTQRWSLEGRTWGWIVPHYYPGSTLSLAPSTLGASLVGDEHQVTLTSGDEMVVWLEYRNDGAASWDPATVRVGTTGPRDRASPFFKADNWIDPTRPTAVDASTTPGAVGRFSWAMVAPEVATETVFTEQFALVTADATWFGPADDAVTWTITVRPRGAGADAGPGPGADEPAGCCEGGGGGGGGAALLGLALAALLGRRRARVCPVP
jgi:hypothetical protein